MLTRFLSPIFILLYCLNFCASFPTLDENLNKRPKLDHQPSTHLPSSINTFISDRQINLPPPLLSTQPKNLQPLLSIKQPTVSSLLSTQNVPLLQSPQQPKNIHSLLSIKQPTVSSLLKTPNQPPSQSNQQPKSLPPLISTKQLPLKPIQHPPLKSIQSTNSTYQSIKLAYDLRSRRGQCEVCLENNQTLYPDCFQCLSKNEYHEFCMNCIVKTKQCHICNAPLTVRYHHMVLLKMKNRCDQSKLYRYKQSCLEKLLKQTIATIVFYPEIGSMSEEIIKYCMSMIPSLEIVTFQIVLANFNILSSEIIDLTIQKYGINKSYSDYLILMIKKHFGQNMKGPISDIHRITSFVEKYGNIQDYSNYNKQAIKSSLEWKLPNYFIVTLFITRFGNQLSDHQLFYKSAIETSIIGSNMDAFNLLIHHFGLNKNRVWISSAILDSITCSFYVRNIKLIEPIIQNYGQQDKVIDYLNLIIENMVKYSITFQTNALFDKFAKESDFPIIINHAIKSSIQESKFDVVKFITKKYGNPESFKLYIFLAIHTSVFISKYDIIQDFVNYFGKKEEYNEYFETAINSCLFYSKFQPMLYYKQVFGKGITDETLIIKTIDLGIKRELYQGLKVFIKEMGNPLHYLDYISLLESMKGTGKDEMIDEMIDYIMSFYFNK